MKHFWKRTLYFLLPLIVFIGVVVLADPYNYYRAESFIPLEVKLATSYKFHYPLWKCIEYKRKPVANILLGDSRTDALGSEGAWRLTGEKWYNFAYGGATVPEIVETFWYANSLTKLKKVYIGLNFNQMNAYKRMNRVTEARNIIDQPLLYPFNKTVTKAFFYNIYYGITGGDPKIGVPEMEPDSFWNFQLKSSAENYYAAFKYGSEFIDDLRKIADHCKKSGIELVIFIPPTHTDLQQRIADYGLTSENERWLRELQLFAHVINLDVPNEFTSVRENFKDPFHTKDPQAVIDMVFRNSEMFY